MSKVWKPIQLEEDVKKDFDSFWLKLSAILGIQINQSEALKRLLKKVPEVLKEAKKGG